MGGFIVDPNSNEHIYQASSKIIRVLGIGGGGGNSLQHMINQSIGGVEFIAINTDAQALDSSTASLKVQIGVKLTNGLGAGCDPNIGRKAAEESKEDIKKLLQGSHLVFITAGMGGGTGTGAAPIIAEVAQEIGALTVAVVTKPFLFEGKLHSINAEAGITELSKHVDSLIVLDNDKLLSNLGANISIINAFNEANDILLYAVRGITDIITKKGFINLDFSDVITAMKGRGHAVIGNGTGQGANFIEDAIQRAIHSPLLEQVDIKSATGLIAYTSVNPNFPIVKWSQICKEIHSYADEEADCKIGLIFDDQLAEDQIEIIVIMTGISSTDAMPSERQLSGSSRNNMQPRNQLAPQTDVGFFRQSQQANFSAAGQQRVAAAASQGLQKPRPAAMGGAQDGRFNQMGNGANLASSGYSNIANKEAFNSEINRDEWNSDSEMPSIVRKKV